MPQTPNSLGGGTPGPPGDQGPPGPAPAGNGVVTVTAGVLDTPLVFPGGITQFLRGDRSWQPPPAGGPATTAAQGVVKVDNDSGGDPVALTSAGHGAAGDPHTQYQKESEKNAAGGYAGLDGSSKLAGAQQVYGAAANTACVGNDARLADPRTPTAHATSHKTGGGDPIKLDELATPDDNTNLNVSTSRHGLTPKLDNDSAHFLNGQGAWATPPAGGSSLAWIRADVNRTLPNNANVNAIFNNPTNGRLTLTTGVYRFKGMLIITGMSATSGNLLINLLGAGTATLGSWLWRVSGLDNTTPATIAANLSAFFQVATSAASIVTAGTGTALRLDIEGTFECTAAGTMIPSLDLVTAAAAVLQAGSFLEVERIGDVNAVSAGAWDKNAIQMAFKCHSNGHFQIFLNIGYSPREVAHLVRKSYQLTA